MTTATGDDIIGESRGIRVRAFRPSDLDTYRRWLQPDQDWHRWDGPYFAKLDAAQIDAVCARLGAALADGSYAAQVPLPRGVVVDADDDDTMLGSVSWHWESEESDWRRMGLTVYDPALRGRGIGTEALRIWTGYLFRTTDAVRLDYSTWSGNERMLAVGRRLGFTEEARFRDAREVRGERYDSVVMGVLRREWQALTS
ncbi:GNAT family N-acetyltransferase [Microbacterium sp. VKM Ac-2870]|uniref:GNAT family N-acetyltransferase n=1 Tax=Microbacterium sp. VKM Ac-2870 TaxID=2783825 RepID=UPI00188AE30B|nr:GNAT family protein [Microbacterium sp. VKM Ac-2870]MBF4561732.1 GNAT family N-acetyltransferase [Microbacterium sp. VKM Ac-2870]